MRNDFITEISESDFRRLNLIGYRNVKVDTGNNSYKFVMTPFKLNEELDKSIEFLKDMQKDYPDAPNSIVLFTHVEPTEEDISIYKKLKNMRGYTISDDEAFKLALIDCSYYDKWMNHSGHSTYDFGVGMDHIYSTRDWWKGNSYWKDYFQVRKKDTKAAYIIHLGL